MTTKRNSAREDSSLHQRGLRLAELDRRVNEASDRLGEAQDIAKLAEKHKQAMQRELIERYREYEAERDSQTESSSATAEAQAHSLRKQDV